MQISIVFENEKFVIDSSKNVKVRDFFKFIRKKYNTNQHSKFLLVGDSQTFDENLINDEILNINVLSNSSSPIRKILNSNFLKAGQKINFSKIDFVLLSIENYEEEKEEKVQTNNFSFSEENKNNSSLLSKEDLIMKVTGAKEPIKLDLRRNLKRRPAIRHNYFGGFMGLNYMPSVGDSTYSRDSRDLGVLRYNPFERDLWNVDEELSDEDEPMIDFNHIQDEIRNTNNQLESTLNQQNTFLRRARDRERERLPSEMLSRRSRLFQSLFFSPIATSINPISNTSAQNIISSSIQNVNNPSSDNSSHILNTGLSLTNENISNHQSNLNLSVPNSDSAPARIISRPSFDVSIDRVESLSRLYRATSSSRAAIHVRQSDVDRLVREMGFEEGRVRIALRHTRNNVNRAVDILLNGPENIFNQDESEVSNREREEPAELQELQDLQFFNPPMLPLQESIEEQSSILNFPSIPNFFDFSRRHRLNQNPQSSHDIPSSSQTTNNNNNFSDQNYPNRFHRPFRSFNESRFLQNRFRGERNQNSLSSNFQENSSNLISNSQASQASQASQTSQEQARISSANENNDYYSRERNPFWSMFENIENEEYSASIQDQEPVQPVLPLESLPEEIFPDLDEEDQQYSENNINEVEIEDNEENIGVEFRLNEEEDDFEIPPYENQEPYDYSIPESESSSQMDT